MKKLITVISITLALVLTLFSFSSCSPKIIQGDFTIIEGLNKVAYSNPEEAFMVKHYDSYQEMEEDLTAAGNFVARVEVAGKSFNIFDSKADSLRMFDECATLTPVRIKEVYCQSKEAEIDVGAVIYLSLCTIYIDEEYYNFRLLESNPRNLKIGDYVFESPDYALHNIVPLNETNEYLIIAAQGGLEWNGNYQYYFEKDGIKAQFYKSLYGPYPLTENIDRSKFSDYYLKFYDGAIAKYGNKEVLE